MKYIITYFTAFLLLVLNSYAQKPKDSISVQFLFKGGVIQSPEELIIVLLIKNISKDSVYAYKYLEEGNLSDNLANFSYDLEIREDSGYKNAKWRYYTTRRDAGSFDSLRHFDLPKKLIGPQSIDTLSFELLSQGGLNKGVYRFRAHLRVSEIRNNTIYTDSKFETEPPYDIINYITSEWFYFELTKPMFGKHIDLD